MMLILRMKNQLELKSKKQSLMIFMNALKKLEGTALRNFSFLLLGESMERRLHKNEQKLGL